MVFCGLYPDRIASNIPALRDALAKLQLNDAALTFEPETSAALGFGFRCGFLGLLHMEIVQERLEREFDLTLIATAPERCLSGDQDRRRGDRDRQPHDLPDPTEIDEIEEPLVEATIIVPERIRRRGDGAVPGAARAVS